MILYQAGKVKSILPLDVKPTGVKENVRKAFVTPTIVGVVVILVVVILPLVKPYGNVVVVTGS